MGNIFDPMPPAKKYVPKGNLAERLKTAKVGAKPLTEPDAKDKAMIAADALKAKQKQQGIGYGIKWMCPKCKAVTEGPGGILSDGSNVCDDCYEAVYGDTSATFYPCSRFFTRCESCGKKHDSSWVAPTDDYQWTCEDCGLLSLPSDRTVLSYTGDASLASCAVTRYSAGAEPVEAWQPAVPTAQLRYVPETVYEPGQFTGWATKKVHVDMTAPEGYASIQSPLLTQVFDLRHMAGWGPRLEGCGVGGCGFRAHDCVDLCATCFDKYKGE